MKKALTMVPVVVVISLYLALIPNSIQELIEEVFMNLKFEDIITKLNQNDATLTHLNLRQQNLSSIQSQEVFKALEGNTAVTHLQYLGNNSSGLAAIALRDMLLRNNTLEQLELGTNQLNNQDIQYIVEGLLNNTSVKILDINCNLFDKEESIAKLLEQHQYLEEIDLTNSNLNDNAFEKLYESLEINENSSLRVFSVYFPEVACMYKFDAFFENKQNQSGLRL